MLNDIVDYYFSYRWSFVMRTYNLLLSFSFNGQTSESWFEGIEADDIDKAKAIAFKEVIDEIQSTIKVKRAFRYDSDDEYDDD